MKVAGVIKVARKRAGLTQAELAWRVGTTQSAVARWEAGDRDPGFETLQRLIRACDLDLSIALNLADSHDLGLALRTREMRPGMRVEHMLDWTRKLQEFVGSVRRVG